MALPPPSPSTTALITGASSGIGATLVTRRRERLEAMRRFYTVR